VLLGIANHDGDGGSFPKLATLAKYANVHPRRVTEALRTLGELGEIVVHESKGGTFRTPEHMKPNLYEFVLTCPEDCDRTRNHRTPGEKLGRNYRGQYNPDHVKDPERVKRAKAARKRSLEAVENARLPAREPSDENSTSAESSTTPSGASSTTPSAGNSTTENHQIEPSIEPGFVGTSPASGAAVENLPPQGGANDRDAATKRNDKTTEQAQRITKGAELARKALRGEKLAELEELQRSFKAAVDDEGVSA
jgi:hypothetical protein